MNQKKTISIIGIIVVIIAIIAGFYISQKSDDHIKQQWIVSGPFAINKAQYKIGENVFMTVNNLQPNEIGSLFIISPQNKTFTVIPFNGTAKDHFNYYFKPDVSKAARITSTDELIGRWLVISDLAKYEPLSFEILNETLPGFTPGKETRIEELMKPTLNKTG